MFKMKLRDVNLHIFLQSVNLDMALRFEIFLNMPYTYFCSRPQPMIDDRPMLKRLCMRHRYCA
jgi:hypothetical protein